jgi:PadR family transcriptional regulator AphA
MSLRHAILSALTGGPMSGWDLVRLFNGVDSVWNAPESQVYTELGRMVDQGLVKASEARRGERGRKKLYSNTRRGERELSGWVAAPHRYLPEHDGLRLKAMLSDLAPPEAARALFEAHISYHRQRVKAWQARIRRVRAGEPGLVQRWLKRLGPEEGRRMLAFRLLAFEGQIARAKAEIAWAKRGLKLLDQFEQGACDEARGA